MRKSLHVYFTGTVQGVGFRFTTERLAKRLNVSGFVKNLPDGRVELMVEGEEKVLEELLQSILNGQLGAYIRDMNASWGIVQDRFTTFEISF